MKGDVILFIALVCGILICGCVSLPTNQPKVVSTSQVTTQVPTGPTVTVIIKNRAFDPTTIEITKGTRVTWINEDPITHRVVHLPTVTQAELFNSGILSTGQSYSYRFLETGTYEYGDPNIGGGRTNKVVVT
jgi:plastocyanin